MSAAVETTSTVPLEEQTLGIAGMPCVEHVSVGSSGVLPTGALTPEPPSEPALDLRSATPMYLVIDDRHAGTFYATDTLRPSAREALCALNALGFKPALLTGDTLSSAQGIATQAGIADVRAKLLPADKVLAVEAMQRTKHRVAMVGDGLNDAGALAQADVGMAVASGTDLAREAGHILLLHHDLRLLPAAVRLARKARRIMRQKLVWAMGYNVVGIPIARAYFSALRHHVELRARQRCHGSQLGECAAECRAPVVACDTLTTSTRISGTCLRCASHVILRDPSDAS